MGKETLWVSESEVTSVVDLHDAIDAIEAGFRQEGIGAAGAMDKTMLGFSGHGTLHALGGAVDGERLVGTKTWAHTPGGADPVLLLFDADAGSLTAVIEAFALGQLRTAATAAVATRCLAQVDASRLAVIGTGKQALAQVAAVMAVTPIVEVRAFSRDPQRRENFAARVVDELGVVCQVAASAQEAVRGAEVVILVTRATSPVLTDAMVEPGMHVNAVGAIDLARLEFEPSLLSRCSLVVTDSMGQAQSFSSEFRQFYGDEQSGWAQVRSLGAVLASGAGRLDAGEVTLFKGMGSGIEDLSLGAEVLRRVRLSGKGRALGRTGRSAPVLRAQGRNPVTSINRADA